MGAGRGAQGAGGEVTRRATFTQSELERAIRAAGKLGKVAVRTPIGIAFVDPQAVGQVVPETGEVNTCDGRFGKGA